MAADIDVTPGAGKTVAADEASSKIHQLVKLVFGNSTTAVRASFNTGALDNGCQRMAIATDDPVSTALVALAAALKAEDAASADGHTGFPAMAIQKATPADTAGADDYSMLQMSAGRLWVSADLTKIGGVAWAAAAALADAITNPTVPIVGGGNLGYNGATWDRMRSANVYKDLSAVAIGSITTVWDPASGKKFRLMGGSISVSAAANVLFEDNAGAAFVFRTPKLAADTPFNFTVGNNGFLSAAVDNNLKATSSAAANITGTLWGTEE